MRPNEGDYNPFYSSYVNLVPEEDLVSALHTSIQELHDALETIPIEKADHAYAEGKWTVKELLQHIIDTERVFSYRAMAFARGEQQSLPGFDENAYAAHALVSHRHLNEMKEELMMLRRSVYLMYKGFAESSMTNRGLANNNPVTVLALGYIIIGHVRHHIHILQERYL
jgi:hypothetical protein